MRSLDLCPKRGRDSDNVKYRGIYKMDLSDYRNDGSQAEQKA